jgi:hypothetical protein
LLSNAGLNVWHLLSLWVLATHLVDASGAEVVALYRRRFTLEESFRDVKDLRFGMGLSSMRIAETDRRDGLLLVSALACALAQVSNTSCGDVLPGE